MAINISLEKLVTMPGTESLWPDEFREMIVTLNGLVDNKTQWGVIADWLADHDEFGLERAFRWVFDRPDVQIELLVTDYNHRTRRYPVWWFRVESKMTAPVWKLLNLVLDDEGIHDRGGDFRTIPALMAWLASFLQKMDTVTNRPEASNGQPTPAIHSPTSSTKASRKSTDR